ncbi:MAG TPA: ATP-binding protein, partial [bacterium]|nr:ATP-binding protein [bacterium]
VEGEIAISGDTERTLLARGTLLQDASGRTVGAVVVFSDVTRLRRLENMRRDFVANVSHELRTPVTSIKGFVETLLDGAINDRDDAQRFLGIIARHADRLNAIIEDLLTLSRIEQEVRRAEIEREVCRLRPILASVIEVCSLRAAEKSIRTELSCEDTLECKMNAPLVEQAVINLVDNAIKYSPSEATVQIAAQQTNDACTISVEDSGCGIPQEHLPRLFERFYRVDKARSRNLGGTGLGLAIVKHIVQAHQGTVSVVSEMGKGSRFTIHIPKSLD